MGESTLAQEGGTPGHCAACLRLRCCPIRSETNSLSEKTAFRTRTYSSLFGIGTKSTRAPFLGKMVVLQASRIQGSCEFSLAPNGYALSAVGYMASLGAQVAFN